MYAKVYQRYVKSKSKITDPSRNLERGGFYQLVEYDYVEEEDSKTWSVGRAPIIYVLYVSGKNDVVHCIKLSDINPLTVKRLFGKLVDEADEELDMGKNAKAFYKNKLKSMKFFSNNFYRTYKLSGIRRIIELEMDTTKLVPLSKLKEVRKGYKTYSKSGLKKNVDTNPND
jgi:hypothetical protein